ncbi:lysoplasmalogenase [Pedococcus bigeumensis]|uniref:Lysoplasmalogenase n=2 Tax=Pedococcus bigeumensis TaxID=433644 RepID=A0A502CUH3_9MICO|nr:lysoplasmalogenase [Pedococcus bigeumensis]
MTSLAAVAVAAPLDWWSVAVRGRRREWVLKPLVLVLLIVTAWLLGAPDSTAGWWLLAALGLSLVGDVALLSDSDPRFVVGLGSFLVAHLVFVVAFAHLGMPRADLGLVGLGLVVGMAVVVGRRVVPAARAEGGPALAGAVAAYMIVIGAMVVTAWATGHPVVALGATVFMVSDAVLALDRFVTARRFGSLAVMVTYHLGQVLIVLGVLSA